MKHNDYHFEYQEEPIQEDEQVLNDGISDECIVQSENLNFCNLERGKVQDPKEKSAI